MLPLEFIYLEDVEATPHNRPSPDRELSPGTETGQAQPNDKEAPLYPCMWCGMVFETWDLRDQHENQPSAQPNNIEVSIFPCMWCGKVFETWDLREYHEANFHKDWEVYIRDSATKSTK
ncbi:hypothetical protein MMC22_008700 [Lobaria immixta]|nr:hypothetical protein [Lobaria immixta]